MTLKMKKILFVCMLIMAAAIGAAHYLTPGHLILFHDSFRRLAYFPIVIGAILYGVRGGLAMACLSCLSFVPHLFVFWYQGAEIYYSELSEILFYLAAGLVIGMISSRENRLREKYQTLSEQLAASYQRLHDQAGRLIQAERELGQARKLSMLGQLSASLAHEIKNPLASIKGAAEILADEVAPDHPKYEFVDIMRSEIARLNIAVEDVLAHCRGRDSRSTDRVIPLDQVVDKAVQVLAPRFREKGVQLVLADTGGAGLEESGVPESAMTQVVINLMVNALDEVGAGGIVRIRQQRQGDGWRVDVDDTGPGVPRERVAEIFRSFVTFKDGGTGLGLSIAQKIVERLGGTIDVDRSDLGGARFSVVLKGGLP